MVRRSFLLVLLALLLAPPTVQAADAPKVGDVVWAQWKPNDWYHGKVAKKADVGLHVAFDDGDKADLPVTLIAVDRAPKKGDVKVGTRTLALWTDKKMYPGTVTKVTADGKYSIQFDDTDKIDAPLEDLRLLPLETQPGRAPKVGDKVWAQWLPNDWYHGKITKVTNLGLHVLFDDGDEADLPLALIAADTAPKKEAVKVGTHLLALWTDGKMYPGTVTKIMNNKYHIQFDDGDKLDVGLEDLRLLNE